MLDFLEFAQYKERLDVPSVHRWSIAHFEIFWAKFLGWSGMRFEGSSSPVVDGGNIETTRFFPEVRLNYAGNLLAGSDDQIAIVAVPSADHAVSVTRRDLRDRVERLAWALRNLGLKPGDHVGGVLENSLEAAIVALAVTALGGVLSTSSPDVGAELLARRFSEFRPKYLFTHISPERDLSISRATLVETVCSSLPSIHTLVTINRDLPTLQTSAAQYIIDDLVTAERLPIEAWPLLPFNHPLFVLFSSGTTGVPKAIVHGAGGTLIEHIKEHRLHCDIGVRDRLFFHTSCGWMMWNWQLSALASQATIVLYEGSVATPQTLWQIVEDQCVTIFGTSPAYVRLCASTNFLPMEHYRLEALRTILSTGSILHSHQYDWLFESIKKVSVHSISGGTDIIGCFVLGSPLCRRHVKECQSLSLALDVRALACDNATSAGELVCANPFPSRPLGFLNDPAGQRFHRSYFSQNDGYWTHGDLIELTSAGGAHVHGRSDGLLKVRGIRVSPSEIYGILLASFPGVQDAMAIMLEQPGSAEGRLILFLVMHEGVALDDWCASRIRRRLRIAASPAHVPHTIIAVDDLPYTFNGKRSEAAMADAVNGRAVRNITALCNPESLDIARTHSLLRPAAETVPFDCGPVDISDRGALERYLIALWNGAFNRDDISADSNFFDLGGNSITAATIFSCIVDCLGRDSSPSILLNLPTVSTLASYLTVPKALDRSQVVELKKGIGKPFFFIHSISGSLFDIWKVKDQINVNRPLYGIEAQGFDLEKPAHDCVRQMAADYITLIRQIQPIGPYSLGGYSFGGMVAFEIAQQLKTLGESMECTVLIDTLVDPRYLPFAQRFRRLYRGTSRSVREEIRKVLRAEPSQRRHMIFTALLRLGRSIGRLAIAVINRECGASTVTVRDDLPAPLSRVRHGLEKAMRDYRPGRYTGELIYICAQRKGIINAEPVWRRVAGQGLKVRRTMGAHNSMVRDHANGLSVILGDSLRARA